MYISWIKNLSCSSEMKSAIISEVKSFHPYTKALLNKYFYIYPFFKIKLFRTSLVKIFVTADLQLIRISLKNNFYKWWHAITSLRHFKGRFSEIFLKRDYFLSYGKYAGCSSECTHISWHNNKGEWRGVRVLKK